MRYARYDDAFTTAHLALEILVYFCRNINQVVEAVHDDPSCELEIP